MKILLNTTSIALWQDVIHEAEAACTVRLKEEVSSYLVFLLDRYTNKPEIIKQIIATEFMDGLNLNSKKRENILQGVGDKCLIFSGLFPHIAEKRLVKISYFVKIGQAAYHAVSTKSSDIYSMLSHQFVLLMDVLQTIRCYAKNVTDLLPLEAYELWNEVGSQRALSVLQQCTMGIPVPIFNEKSRG